LGSEGGDTEVLVGDEEPLKCSVFPTLGCPMPPGVCRGSDIVRDGGGGVGGYLHNFGHQLYKVQREDLFFDGADAAYGDIHLRDIVKGPDPLRENFH